MKHDYRKYMIDRNIIIIDTSKHLKEILKREDIIFCTRCSKTKTGLDRAIPEQFYVSPLNIRFYNMMNKYNLYFGIISDEYGIHFKDEELDFYDVHPSVLTDEKKQELGRIIKEKMTDRKLKSLIFYNDSPLLSKPYLEILTYSGLDIYFIKQLKLIDEVYKSVNKLF